MASKAIGNEPQQFEVHGISRVDEKLNVGEREVAVQVYAAIARAICEGACDCQSQ